MEVVETVAGCRALLDEARAAGRQVGLVPTMGALHDGHTSLIDRARVECDVVAVTIFVNPLQFGDPADIAHYPRTLEQDLAACTASGVDVVFVPKVEEMYPTWPAAPSTTVSVRGVSDAWEGASRPGHFDGVATVVAKLFTMAGPCRAYFGVKDFQQVAVVRRMASELSLPVEIVACAIVREPDGLALSSRNVRLSAEERQAAIVLSRALAAGRAALRDGEPTGNAVSRVMQAVVAAEPLVELDYAVLVDNDTLEEIETVADRDLASLRLLIAAQVGPVRLIDNSKALATATRDDVRAVPAAAAPARRLERIG